VAPLGPGPRGAATLGPGAAMSPESIPANAGQVQKIVGCPQGGRSHLCLSYLTLGVRTSSSSARAKSDLSYTPLSEPTFPFHKPMPTRAHGTVPHELAEAEAGEIALEPCQLNLLHHDNPRPELDPHLRSSGVKSKRDPPGLSTNARTCKSEAVHVIRADRILADRLANHPPVAICPPTK
jgi:hypothetical protein